MSIVQKLVKSQLIKFNILYWIFIFLLLYTRFVNLDWGLPYPFHPDERNMADAITQLSCSGFNADCFNPHFFAYGQFPLYLAYGEVFVTHLFTKAPLVSFIEAVIALRVISAVASILMVIFMVKTVELFFKQSETTINSKAFLSIISLIFVFSPGFIQFAHFGTTESLLMLFYTVLIFLAIRFIKRTGTITQFVVASGVVSALALATKVSAYSFLLIPVITIILSFRKMKFFKKALFVVFYLNIFTVITFTFAVLLSPHNIISVQDFLGSMRYESAVGFGEAAVFYTRQFQMVIPVLFQFTSIFPFAVGKFATVLFIISFIVLPRKKEFTILRVAFLIYFLLNAFLFTKWTRFMAPVMPIMLIMVVLLIKQSIEVIITKWSDKVHQNKVFFANLLVLGVVFALILPGIAYLSVCRSPDVRFTASNWIYSSIPADSVILSETANVVDLPIMPRDYPTNKQSTIPSYQVISFNSYEVDVDPALQISLKEDIKKADYIIIPSRRVFANHTCYQTTLNNKLLKDIRCRFLQERYPILNKYYSDLFSGKLGFKLVKEFSSEPTISIAGKVLYTIPDEEAEETWTVFDHPKIRVYKKVSKN